MPYKPLYLQQQKRRFKGIRPVGEVFYMHVRDVGYMYGKVVRNDCAYQPLHVKRPWPREHLLHLVYIYTNITQSIELDVTLSPQSLLFAPERIHNAGWKLGYFVPMRVDTLDAKSVLQQHCFDFSGRLTEEGRKRFGYPHKKILLDEYGDFVTKPYIWKGTDGIGEYGWIDTLIIETLKLKT